MFELSLPVVLLIVIVITLTLGVKIVPQGFAFIVQRLGKFHQTLGPGFHFVIPYIDSVAFQLTTKDIVLEIPSQEVITRDNAVITANAVAYINIISPERAVYGVENFTFAIQNLVQTSLRSLIGEMSLDDALSSRDQIKARLKDAISDDISEWGITLKSVEIQDINPSNTMQQAMEEQAAAERERRATVSRAEGLKEAQILKADGQLEASKREAQAKIVLAKGNQEAIEKVKSAIQDNELPALFILGEKYINAVKELSKSENSKFVLLPSDLKSSIQGF